MAHFSYFMLRLRRASEPGPVAAVTGTLQQLSTSEKRAFGDIGELVDLLLAWSEPSGSKVGPAGGEGNALVPGFGARADGPDEAPNSRRIIGGATDARRTP